MNFMQRKVIYFLFLLGYNEFGDGMKKIFLSIMIVLVITGSIIGIHFAIQSNKKKSETITTSSKFSNLGYSDSDIKVIETLKNPEIILNYDYNEKIINLIQNDNFKEENIESYIEFLSLYNFDISDIIYVVNHNFYNKNIQYTDKVISLMKQKYFIMKNLDRYLNYEESSDLDYIITMINSNRDYDYYTNVEETDLSKGYLILVNKYHKLKSDYVPDNLVTIDSKYGKPLQLEKTVYEAYIEMFNAAKEEGMNLYIRSPYRSYTTQNGLYERYAAQDGYSKADTYSARPGYSEHQTGLAFDVTTPSTTLGAFETTKEFNWLKENAYQYGFILRYPKGKENITGYIYESWHYRYVGKEVAKQIHDDNLTFEEYYEYYVK
mgnify:FL=1